MRVKILFVLFLLIPTTSVNAQEAALNNIPSTEFTELIKTSPDRLIGLHKSMDKRVRLFRTSWVKATKASPVDNRAYLFALAIDLYNSIPPDLMPKHRELAPGEDIYEPNLRPIKQQLYDDIRFIDKNPARKKFSLEKNKKFLSRFKKKLAKKFEENSSEWNLRLSDYFESEYLWKYLREQVTQGNFLIDAYDAPSTVNSTEIDILNPKYYSQLSEYMESVQPLIDARIPPWEEATDSASPKKEGEKETLPKPIVNQPEASPPPKPELKKNPESTSNPVPETINPVEQKNILPAWLYIGVAGVVVILIAIRVLREKPGK